MLLVTCARAADLTLVAALGYNDPSRKLILGFRFWILDFRAGEGKSAKPQSSIQNPVSEIQTCIMPDRILVADDYEDNRELLRLMLEVVGYKIREARNGRECVEMARDELPDLILVDLSMPLLDGYGVLRELRADDSTRHIPMVAVTAFADTDRERALNFGFDAYLSKPFRSKDLLATVRHLLSAEDGDGHEQ